MTERPAVHPEPLTELGCYGLAGHVTSPRDVVAEVQTAEALGIGSVFLSERYNTKEIGAISGAVGAVSTVAGIATAATNHNTRHPLLTAAFATTMHTMTDGRFALGLGRGNGMLFEAIGLSPVTGRQIEDFTGIMRRLWKGEMILGHDGPAGAYPYLRQETYFDFDIPVMMVGIGPRSLELAGRCMDGVVLHTFLNDEAVTASLAAVDRGAKAAGRDPATIRVWSVLATLGDHVPSDLMLRRTVGRLATYLQGYGDVLVGMNGWDPAVLGRFRADAVVRSFLGAIDDRATQDQLEHLATLIPEDWLSAAARGRPDACAAEVLRQFDLGVGGVIMHGATPAELAPVVEAYRRLRPVGIPSYPVNPGRRH
jgi:5,10-methylenetetrahydromethanopterin reductase